MRRLFEDPARKVHLEAARTLAPLMRKTLPEVQQAHLDAVRNSGRASRPVNAEPPGPIGTSA